MAEIVIPYKPRYPQDEIHKALESRRFVVLVAHRRLGKTVCVINHLIKQALLCGKERGIFGYVAPFRNQAKSIAWLYLKHFTAPLPGREINEVDLCITVPNAAGSTSQIRIFGADNANSLRGLYFDGVCLDEVAQMDPEVWGEIIRPALADRMGFAVFIGTPKGMNLFHELYTHASTAMLEEGSDWCAALYKADETGVISPAELEALRKEISDEAFRQEFLCDFAAALPGAYYGRHMEAARNEGRIARYHHEPSLPVVTAWDLGVGDATSIWFAQQCRNEVRIIDYYEGSGVGLEHYVKVLREKPYAYGDHLFPHDIKVRELGSGKSRIETLQGFGVTAKVVAQIPVDDGINAVRLLLPRCYFDADNCKRGVDALTQYQTEWNEKLHTFGKAPRHDWTSHAADAFRTLAVGIRKIEVIFGDRPHRPVSDFAQTDFDVFAW